MNRLAAVLLCGLMLVLAGPASAAYLSGGDIACESSSTAGTGTLDLDGAYGQYLPFSTYAADGDTFTYHLRTGTGLSQEVETGIATYHTGTPNTLDRLATWSSDGSGTELTLAAGSVVCLAFTTEFFTAGLSTLSLAQVSVTDLAYDATSWDGSTAVPTRNAVRDKIETLQPLDSDLTSWAGVTRASGFDTFAATPSSANLSSLLTDETFNMSDAELGAIAGLTSANNKCIEFTGSGTASAVDCTATGLSFMALAAGTSGGVPYFSAANTVSSTGALTQYGPLYGGGAGVGPTAMAAATDGQFIVGQTSAAPLWKTVSGDVTAAASGAISIGADKITESMLKAVDAPNDEECLTYETTVGDFEWQSCGGGSLTPWTSDIDSDGFFLLVDDSTGIKSSEAGNGPILYFSSAASAVNGWLMTNSAANGVNRLEPTGTDAAIAITLASKSTDPINFEVNGNTEATLNATNFSPGANDGNALGVSGTAWSDEFLATGAVIDWGAGNMTLTHSSGVLTLAGGNLFIQNAIELGDASSTTIDIASAGEINVEGKRIKHAGKQTIWVPANAMTPNVTNGCALSNNETTTNDIMFATCDFDTTTQQAAQFSIAMPKSWNESTVTAIFYWSHPATATNFGVEWDIACGSYSNDDALDTALGTAIEVGNDTGGTTDDVYVTSETGAVTCAGTPAEGDLTVFRVRRVPADAGDNLAVDARLHGVKLFWTDNASSDD